MKFKDFILEEVISKLDKDELITAKEIVKIIQSENLQKTKVLYRGFNGMRQYFAEVSNDRSSFYGGLKDSVTTFIKNYLKVKNPTFATTDMTQASMFGAVYIFLPQPKDKLHQSDVIRDILSDISDEEKTPDDFKDLQKLYKENKISTVKRTSGEIIVDTKKYFLIDYISFTKSFRTKFFKPKNSIEKLTYGDIEEALNAYIGLEEWKINKGIRQSFDNMKSDSEKSIERMKKLRKARTSKEQLSIRLDNMIDALEEMGIENEIDYKVNGSELEFRTLKSAKESWKLVKTKIEHRSNELISRDLSKIDFLDGELIRKVIKIK